MPNDVMGAHMTGEWCVTANLEKAHKPGTARWLTAALGRRPALVFGQEWADKTRIEEFAAQHGYRVVWPARIEPGWWVVSWLLVRDDLPSTPMPDAGALEVFDSYVAATGVDWPGLGPLSVVSVHASPQPVNDDDLARWRGALPPARMSGTGVRHAGRLFYSDLVIDALRLLAAEGPVVAAGDFNEARGWDATHPGESWGKEFFDAVERGGLRDVTFGLWGEERRTRFHATHPPYQLDFVLATPQVSSRIAAAEVDPLWSAPEFDIATSADHAPVWFQISTAADV